ncbi:MAG: ABC transporter permease [Spirochaetes bacterium]|nr:MAG: ABC transporter permease [Spirochaetota bacterium]
MKVFTSANEKKLSNLRLIGLISTLFLLLLWKIISIKIGADIILPPPEDVLIRLIEISKSINFWQSILKTTTRTLYGFTLSFGLGFITGIACGSSKRVSAALSPLISVIRAIPVMSIILIAMIWFRTDMVPVFVCFLMIFPIITANVSQGISEVDRSLIEMASAFKLSRLNILFHITIPSTIPFVLAGVRAAVGVAWKSVIAAEVLSLPVKAIGTGIQFSQMNLETAEVIAWTVIAVILSKVSEFAVELIIKSRKWRSYQ